MTSILPEVGQVVKVRDRHWAVAEIMSSEVPADIRRYGGGVLNTLVDLSSVEDYGQGEQLTVALECEPSTTIPEASTLPTCPMGLSTIRQ